jgi:cation:H+ antiporter
MFAPIVITRSTLVHEIPLCILASIVVLICGNDMIIDHGKQNILSSTDGLIMLCFFAIFIAYILAIAHHKTPDESGTGEIKQLSWIKSILYIILGLAALIFGGQLLVTGATGIARSWGISESIIGVTIVAVGTSLPELATSIVAALKKNPEIAIGNVVGSNIFNIFFILGCSATITPLPLKGITNFDFLWLVGSALLLWFFALFFGKRIIMRFEGSIMLISWIVYTALLIIRM